MTRFAKLLRVVWLCVAIGLALVPSGSGDANLLAGWLFFAWTFPFSGVWWFYLYDVARQYMSVAVAQTIGSALIIVCAYAFWFWLIPLLRAKASKPRSVEQ